MRSIVTAKLNKTLHLISGHQRWQRSSPLWSELVRKIQQFMRESQYIQPHTDASSISRHFTSTHSCHTEFILPHLHCTWQPDQQFLKGLGRLFKHVWHENARTQTVRPHFLGLTTALWAIRDEGDSPAVMLYQHWKILHKLSQLGRNSSK